jgi:hypothetical protein
MSVVKSPEPMPTGTIGCQLTGKRLLLPCTARRHPVGATSVRDPLAHSAAYGRGSPNPPACVVIVVPARTWGPVRFVALAPPPGRGDLTYELNTINVLEYVSPVIGEASPLEGDLRTHDNASKTGPIGRTLQGPHATRRAAASPDCENREDRAVAR